MLVIYSYQLVDEKDFLIFYNRIKERLPDALTTKIEAFKFVVDQQRSLMADLLIRLFYAQELEINWTELRFLYNEHDKPSLQNSERHYFNISHSGEEVVAAFSHQEVGIDVEKMKGDRRKIAQRFFTPEEISDMLSQPNEQKQVKYFYRLWTLKESYMKALGTGLTMSLSSFAFEKADQKFHLAFSAKDKQWNFHTPKWTKGYYCSICSKENKISEIKSISLGEISAMIGS